MTRPPERLSSVSTWLATSHGLRLGSGVSMVPSRIVDVRMAAAVSMIHASLPHVGSQQKNPSQPACSASAARSAATRASPPGNTKPYFMGRSCPVPPPIHDALFLRRPPTSPTTLFADHELQFMI